jgi:cellulose synthase/poly-beta-1,6-N-acetylglucosamine synthase-like glycosyltransferase
LRHRRAWDQTHRRASAARQTQFTVEIKCCEGYCCPGRAAFYMTFRPIGQEASELEQTNTLPLSIVVPCFNEEAGLRELVPRCCESAVAAVGEGFELILVDDGSSDGRWQAIMSEIDSHPNIVAIKLLLLNAAVTPLSRWNYRRLNRAHKRRLASG